MKQLLLLFFVLLPLLADSPLTLSIDPTPVSPIEDSSSAVNKESLPTGSFFEVANGYYRLDRFDSAEVYYLKALNEMGNNSALLYNLSNAVYRQHRLGEAVLLLERAKLRNPNDLEIAHNLAYLNTQIVDRISTAGEGGFGEFLTGAHSLLPLKEQMILLAILGTLFLLLFALMLFKKHLRSASIYAALVLFVLIAVVMTSVGYKVYRRHNDRYAIILTESIEAKNEPRGVTLIFTLHEGTKVQVLKSREQWSFIKLPSGSAGWIPESTLGIIE